jgi:cell division protein FtsL
VAKLNLVLALVLVLCALGVVTSQHKARKLYVDLQQTQSETKRLDEEWGQLQLEQSTWAMHSRIEKIATGYLQMQVPDAAHSRIVPPAATTGVPGP